jgi:uncharacterized membrane protein (DUF4010 family)
MRCWLAGAVATLLGHGALLVVLAAVAVLAALAYRATRADDPGLTGEVTLLLTTLLGGLAASSAALATALAVVVALLLYAKAPLHRFSRQLLTEREVSDGLMLLAAALVILPALPDRGLGPFGAINPATIWKLVVLVMAVSALGHICLRLVGSRWGWRWRASLPGMSRPLRRCSASASACARRPGCCARRWPPRCWPTWPR